MFDFKSSAIFTIISSEDKFTDTECDDFRESPSISISKLLFTALLWIFSASLSSVSLYWLLTDETWIVESEVDVSAHKRKAFVTLANSEQTFVSALVIARMLQLVESQYQTAIFIHPTIEGARSEWVHKYRTILPHLNASVEYFPKDLPHELLQRPNYITLKKKRFERNWTPAWAKLGFFGLTKQFSAMVWLDNDVLIMKNIDELLDIAMPAFVIQQEKYHEEPIKCINSGVYVIIPNRVTTSKLVSIVRDKSKSRKFSSDQNVYTRGYLKDDILGPYTLLSPLYNMNSQLCETGRFVRVYHMYHHKPWYDSHWEKHVPQCVKNLTQSWREIWWSVEEIARAEDVDMKKFDTFEYTE